MHANPLHGKENENTTNKTNSLESTLFVKNSRLID